MARKNKKNKLVTTSPYYKNLIFEFAKMGLSKKNLKGLTSKVQFNELESVLDTINYIKDFPNKVDAFSLSEKVKDDDIEQTLFNISDTMAKTAQIGADISMQSKVAGASYKNFGKKLTENTIKYNRVIQGQQDLWESRARRLIYFGSYLNYKGDEQGFRGLYKDWTDEGIKSYLWREKNFSKLRKVESKIFKDAGIEEDVLKKINRTLR